MEIENRKWKSLSENDFFVFVIGHEERSIYLYSLCRETRNKNNSLAISINNNVGLESLRKEIVEKGIEILNCEYSDYEKVLIRVQNIISSWRPEKGTINIDYSSMPRSWYCHIVLDVLRAKSFNTIIMWYTAGNYPLTHIVYPSTVEDISVFSGTAIPSVGIKRYHLMGLGFDATRSETIRTVIEPDSLICCCAYDENNKEVKNAVLKKNKQILKDADLIVTFPIMNFKGMIDGLSGLVYDIISDDAQAILVPDGPKPLIMAMSLIPTLIARPGVTCLHIKSNEKHYKPVNISSRNEIWGFSVTNWNAKETKMHLEMGVD